ncbi:MAG TPA: PHP domain-containing protein [Actinomycetota bacterium]|nr:PHP domain-containing protein [Actinomycetota bacterium]
MPGSFAHLHVHTEYSMLDGAARVDDLFAEAARMDMPALAMTDHGQLFGAVDFYLAGQKHGVKPILGTEAYLAPGPGSRSSAATPPSPTATSPCWPRTRPATPTCCGWSRRPRWRATSTSPAWTGSCSSATARG